MAKKVEVIEIPPLKLEKIELNIVGNKGRGSGLIVHAWADKAKKEILDKQQGKPKQGKVKRDPDRDYREGLYWLDKNGKRIAPLKTDPSKHKYFGFPSVAFKAAAVNVANDVGLPMTFTRRAFFVDGEFVKIEFDELYMREDMVKIGMGTSDLRYRGEFVNWRAKLNITFNASIIQAAQIVNLFNTAGFGVGVGEWRMQKNGMNGCFSVA